MIKQSRFWIGLAIAVLFLVLFFRKTDILEMLTALEQANYIFIIPAVFVYFIGVWFRVIRWQYLLKPLASVPSYYLFPMIVIGFMINDILPARLGIVARAILLGNKAGISKMATGATILVERIFDVLSLLLFLVFPLLFVPLPDWAVRIVWVFAPLSIVVLTFMILMTSSNRLTRKATGLLEYFTPRRWKHRMVKWTELFITGLGQLCSPSGLALLFITSLAVWLSEAAVFYIVSLSFKLGLPFYVVLLATSIANFAWALFIPPGGVGPFDFFGQQILIFFGVGASVAAAYVGALHAVILLPPIILGFIFLATTNLSLKEVTIERVPDSQAGEKSYFEEGKG